ncbi:hypothetical protein AKJ50_00845 [candidate division MSBL1 archaeon SCGC-AAA382A13]|uniref:Thiamine biosynthesis protein ThiS n=1 Tax=candidate division MSBL1 archaeon SCGC-AAA382A13 TaxID=1698279 RepID=A0A133VGC1_9EURY|nr:hypothetical protein AKJ50_00845 [candidate division MSBL1 archaeon SCGC-AAA382A13]
MSKIKVDVKIIGEEDSKICSLSSDTTILELLEKIDQNPETVVVKRDGKIISEEEKLKGDGEIQIIPVVSGG